MDLRDATGHRLTGATADGRDRYVDGCRQMLCLVDDPLAAAEAAIAAAPGMTMAHVLKAWLCLLGTEPAGLPMAVAALDRADDLPAGAREQAHRSAARALAQGRWHDAGRQLEDLSMRWPRDTLALQCGHQVDFFTGRTRLLRDRIARALPAWDAGVPGWHAVLGMHAFGLEENGEYDAALAAGEQAVALEPRDGWAWHAVAHVHEMRGDAARGIAWLASTRPVWSRGSFFHHLVWHLALFHLAADAPEAALALHDDPSAGIGARDSMPVLDLVDASSLLWRLALAGADVGDRWAALARGWQVAGGHGRYAFNDLHAMLAYVGAGDDAAADALLAAQQEALARGDDNAAFTRDVGAPAARAVRAYAAGDAAAAVQGLRPVLDVAHRFGGSHAQRELLELTLLAAAEQAGDAPLVAALAAERLARRPQSASARRLVARWPVRAFPEAPTTTT